MIFLTKLIKNPSATVGFILIFLVFITCLVGPLLTQSPFLTTSNRLSPPTREHILGTDELGRDVLSRIVLGGRYSIAVGFISVFLGLICGFFLGTISGYYGKIWDKIIMAIADLLLAFPGILLSICIAMVMPPSILTPMIAVGISTIPLFTRLVRAQFMSIKNHPYIDAVRCLGANDLRVIFLHFYPNIIGPIIIQSTLRVGSSILVAATLNFLGLGAQPPIPEWGAMLNSARPYLWSAPYLAIFPGLAITITIVGINLIGDALRDYLDPRIRKGI